MATKTATIQLSDVLDAIRSQYADALDMGQHWHYVCVWPDGDITSGCEASPCYPESEYYSRGKPHPITVWSMQSNWNPGPGDGVFDWDRCGDDDAEFYAADDFVGWSIDRDDQHTIPCRLSKTFLEEPEFDETEIVARLEDAGYVVE